MMKFAILVFLLSLPDSYGLQPIMTMNAAVRELGAMESLFLPRRSGMESCTIPSTKHICVAIRDGKMSDADLLKGATEVIRTNLLLMARVAGNGAPEARGPSPLAKAGVLKNVLAPFGDANMRLGNSPNPLRFEMMDLDPVQVAQLAMEPTVEVLDDLTFDQLWQRAYINALSGGNDHRLFDDENINMNKKFEFDVSTGPLWRFKAIRSSVRTALILGLDHAISDQTSLMAVLEQFGLPKSSRQQQNYVFPASLESVILDQQGGRSRGFTFRQGKWPFLALDKGSLNYLLSKLWSERSCVSPLIGSHTKISPPAQARRTFAIFRKLKPKDMASLRSQAKAENTTIGATLAAIAAQCFAERANLAPGTRFKVLQSLDMRRFQKDAEDSQQLSCRAGSMDLVLDGRESLWPLAREASKQLSHFIDRGFGIDCVRVFDWGVDAMEMTRLVQLEADNPFSKGRAYATGVSNAGVYVSNHWQEVYYATSTAYAGSTIQVYVITLKDKSTCICFSAVEGVVESSDELDHFADNFMKKMIDTTAVSKYKEDMSILTNGILCAFLGFLVGAILHLDAWSAFFSTLVRMYNGVGGRVSELVAPMGFWLFFTVMHPLVGGAGVGLGELAWQFPGYITGDLDAVGPPVAFTLLSVLVTNAVLSSRPARAALAAFVAFWFSTTVTAGVAGTTSDLGSYNLALDDAPFPAGQSSVRGCPAFDQVASPQIQKLNFDVAKYQGTWYEHAYHDWTQFSEVYDTSLEISLADDKHTWIDIFKVKGPSPTRAPHSWRGSPVAMGAAYPLYGDLPDVRIPVINELGFGNYFPNFVIDLQTDPVTGDYTEAIQFQCLEAGGVRVFEGINFLSRKSQISPSELDAMFERAKSIAPYGGTREQMHLVEHVDNFQPIQNWWQDAWRFVAFTSSSNS